MRPIALSPMRRCAIGLLGLVAACATGLAQEAAPFDPREFAARSIARVALLDLRNTERPTDDDYRIAAQLLAIAHDITPDDLEILRCRLEAAFACGDDERVLELTRDLLIADPKDTVAQLRLITANIAKNNQNAEDRIQVYEQFLDPAGRGKAIDPSVLSRLALDAALLLRERGDDPGFIRKLTQAVQLDSTHKEAAQLAATVFAERRPDDRVGRLAMMEHLLMADPVDPNVHLSIAHELVAGGAYAAARRFEDNASAIMSALGAASDKLLIERFTLTWRSKGPAEVVAQLNGELAVARDAAEREIHRLQARGEPTDRANKPEDVRLSAMLRFMYIMALDASGEAEAVRQAITELSADIAKRIALFRKAFDNGELSAEQMTRAVLDLGTEIHTLRLWTGNEIEVARKSINADEALSRDNPETAALLHGWLAVRSDDLEAARTQLEPYTDTAPWAVVGIGLAHELAGHTDLAIAAYRRAAQDRPLEIMGAWAASRAAGLGAKDDPAVVAALEGVVRDIPAFIDKLVQRPQDYQQLRVSVLTPHPDAIDRVRLHLSLQNLSTIPLALGADRPVSSRLLLAPKLEAMGSAPLNLIQPEVIDLDRRLRLMPQEKLEIDFWPDAGQSGWLMEAIANRSIRVRWRVIQGFQIAPAGGYIPGLMGLTTETDSVVRRPLAETSLPPELLATRIATEPVAILPRLAAAARAIILQPLFAPTFNLAKPPEPVKPGGAAPPMAKAVAPELSKLVADAFAARYPKLSPVDRAMLAAVLPHARLAPAMASVDQVMRAETDPVPLCVILSTRVVDPADELLVRCKDSEDPRVKDMAELVRRRLDTGGKTFAKFVVTDIKPIDKKPDIPDTKAPEPVPPPGGGVK